VRGVFSIAEYHIFLYYDFGMRTNQKKLLTVPANGQISIGKSWAGRHILVEEIGGDEIRISSGVFVPDSQRTFHSKEAKESLDLFSEWEKTNSPKGTDVESLFSSLRKKKQARAK
jgi:hypothetical protein